jgi:hypothetical protein
LRRDGSTGASWLGDAGLVTVEFYEEDDTVWQSSFLPGDPVSQGPLDNLLWRAKRQWRRLFP